MAGVILKRQTCNDQNFLPVTIKKDGPVTTGNYFKTHAISQAILLAYRPQKTGNYFHARKTGNYGLS
jgi:hypothetical protein